MIYSIKYSPNLNSGKTLVSFINIEGMKDINYNTNALIFIGYFNYFIFYFISKLIISLIFIFYF